MGLEYCASVISLGPRPASQRLSCKVTAWEKRTSPAQPSIQ